MKTTEREVAPERSVLGAILLNPDCLTSVQLTLDREVSDWFALEAHNAIYSTFTAMQHSGKSIDALTLRDELENRGVWPEIDRVGGFAFLTDLTGAVPTSANVSHYAEIVAESYKKRQLESLTLNVRAELLDGKKAEEIEDLLRRELRNIFENRTRGLVPDDIGYMLDNPAPRMDFLFDGIVPLDTLAGCDAAGGSGKGFMTHELVVSLCTGKTILSSFKPTRVRRVLWLQAEETTAEMHRRLERIVRRYGLSDDERLLLRENVTCYSKQPGPLNKKDEDGKTVPTDLFNDIRDDARRLQPGMIIIDPRANFFAGNENDNIDVQAFMALLVTLADEVEDGCTVWINHHSSKARQTDNGSAMGRGASAGRDAMRCLFNLTCLTDKEVTAAGISNPKRFVKLELSKSNWTAPLDGSIYFRRCTGEHGGVLEEIDFRAMVKESRGAVSNQLAESLADLIGDNPQRDSVRDICKGDSWKAARAELKAKHDASQADIKDALEHAEKIGLISIEEEAQRSGSPKRIPKS